jgi:hypothetical protein
MPLSNDIWKSVTLDHVFNALALSSELSEKLIYKGARVLRLLLNEITRASLDIDANFAANVSVDQKNLEQLRSLAHEAIATYFESQSPIRYELQNSSIKNRRPEDHPRDWNVYWLELAVRDLAAENFMGATPSLLIDIAAPEPVSDKSIARIEVNGHLINAVTLERMAGEKMRAFLSHLPTYRKKIFKKPKIHTPRVKDIYDLSRIIRKRPIDDRNFWQVAAQEFKLACQSRYIDCDGIHTFKERWGETRQTYNNDPTIPKDVLFNDAEKALEQIVAFIQEISVIPFSFEIPPIE